MSANPADMPTEPMRCAVCGLPLEAFQAPGGGEVTYIHSRQYERDDHVAVPVPLDAMEGTSRCDFCDQPNDTWIVMADSFRMPMQGLIEGHVVDQNSSGNWAACDECKPLVERRAWGQLTTRVKSLAPKQWRTGPDGITRGSSPRKVYLALYAALEPNIREIITREEWVARGKPVL